jgi:uncharacterized Fe-S cluster protein YjdI
MSKEHTYTNGEITIIWKKDLCIHSTRCWRELGTVFQPGKRPWIKPEGASTDAIRAQVERCPSGALTFRMSDGTEAQGRASDAALRVEVSPDGPLLVKGPCTVVHPDGRVEERERNTALCRCGASANKPYCDGSHRRTGFTDGAGR